MSPFPLALKLKRDVFQGGNCEIDGKYDNEDFQSLLSAMQVLGFTSDEQDTIFRILASGEHYSIISLFEGITKYLYEYNTNNFEKSFNHLFLPPKDLKLFANQGFFMLEIAYKSPIYCTIFVSTFLKNVMVFKIFSLIM